MAQSGAGLAPYDPGAAYPVQETELDYYDDGARNLRVRIFQPRGAGPFPALLSVHGGAWTSDGWANSYPICRTLAASGVVVAAIQLRRAPDHPYPQSVQDVNYAARWLKTRATAFNADASCLGGIGHSSGGHLVTLSSLRPHDPRYGALAMQAAMPVDASLDYLIALWSPIDPFARYQHALATGQDGLAANHIGYFLHESAMREGNPQRIVDEREFEALPPLLLIHGTGDAAVPVAIPEHFYDTYRAAGGAAELELFPDMPHSFVNRVPGAEADRAITVIESFIARQVASQVQ